MRKLNATTLVNKDIDTGIVDHYAFYNEKKLMLGFLEVTNLTVSLKLFTVQMTPENKRAIHAFITEVLTAILQD